MPDYRPRALIGVCGKAGSGKDTVADALVERLGFVRYGLADELKRIAREGFGWTDAEKALPAGRRFLQELGCAARHWRPDYWVHALEQILAHDRPERVVVPDIRFPNEAAWVYGSGGILFGVRGRGGLPTETAGHESEAHADVLLVAAGSRGALIDNSKLTIPQLKTQACRLGMLWMNIAGTDGPGHDFRRRLDAFERVARIDGGAR